MSYLRNPNAAGGVVNYAVFRARWTDAEKEALHEARLTSWQIDDYVELALAKNAVDVSGPTAGVAKGVLIAAGVLTGQRANEIFSAEE
jgi:hypothetical protein